MTKFRSRFFYVTISLILTSIVFALSAAAQSEIGAPNITVAPSSPNAAALGKYGETPVGLFTGIPEIGIPLHSMKLKTMEIPISLSYFAGGNKVNDVASNVGLGWSLNAGGAITCSINGISDLEDGGWLQTAQSTLGYYNSTGDWTAQCDIWINDPDFMLLQSVADRVIDSQPDMFYLSMPGKSLKFFFDRDAKIVTIPYDPIKIEFINTTLGFRVTDEQDVVYEFGAIDPSNTNGQVNTSYLLSKITTPNMETVNLTYAAPQMFGYANQPSETRFYTLYPGICTKQAYATLGFTSGFDTRLMSIVSSLGDSVTFGYGFDRLDLSGAKALTGVKVWHKTSPSVLKEYSLAYTHAVSTGAEITTDNYRLRLLSVTETGKPPHQFFYNTLELPSRLSFSQDHWGFYNAKSNTTLLPEDVANNFPIGADRGPVGYATAAGILKKIVYPTGGSTVFNFGPNFAVESKVVELNGLATALAMDNSTNTKYFTVTSDSSTFKVTHNLTNGPYFDNDQSMYVNCKARILDSDHNIVATFSGGTPPSGISFQHLNPGNYSIELETTGSYPAGSFRLDWFTPHFQTDTVLAGGLRIESILNYSDNETTLVGTKRYEYKKMNGEASGRNNYTSSYVYDVVHIIQAPGTENTNGQVLATLDCFYKAQSSNINTAFVKGSPMHYLEVSVYDDTKSDRGFTHHRFSPVPGAASSKPVYPYAPLYAYDWLAGLPIETTSYKYVAATGTYTPISRVVNDYNMVHGNDNPTLNERTVMGFNSVQTQEKLCPFGTSPRFKNEFFSMVSSWPFMKSSTETTFDAADSTKKVVVENKYFYDNPSHGKLTRQEISRSNGEKFSLSFSYPKDIDPSYAHVSSPVVEKRVMVDNGTSVDLVAAELTAYKTGGGIFPVAYYALNLGSPVLASTVPPYTGTAIDAGFEKRVEYTYDAKNSLVGETKDGTVKSSYLYGYKGAYPVAVIKNADYASAVAAAGGSTAVSNFSALAKPTPTELNAFFGLLRAGLPNAMVSTFVYEPGVGLAAQTDAKGLSTSYEYDRFNRLINMKDQNGSIVKNYRYNYGSVQFTNVAKTGSFTKNNCPSGIGSTVSYTVPAGTFSAPTQLEADALAVAARDTEGQAYANAHGACTVPVYAKIFYENLSINMIRTKADIIVRFFSDAGCTVPASVSSLSVPYKIYDDLYNVIYSGSVTASGTSAEIEHQGFIQQNDEFGTPIIFYEYLLGTSGSYTIVF